MKATSSTTSATRAKKTEKKPADALALLKDDHQAVQQLFKDFEKIQENGSPEEKLNIVLQACSELKVHTEIEEQIFYPAIRQSIDDELLLDEAEVEHKSAKDLISQLESMKSDDPKFDAVFTVLAEYIVHHVEEEEKEMFPKVKKAKLDLAELGERMQELKDSLMGSQNGSAKKTTAKTSKRSAAH